jgi:hypothetical protein
MIKSKAKPPFACGGRIKYSFDSFVKGLNHKFSLLKIKSACYFLLCFLFSFLYGSGQMITGVWKGKIGRQRTEVKIIQKGDSLTGTSYYYESGSNYRRYSIKGYFDADNNSVVWWDDRLIEEKSGRFNLGAPGKMPMLSRADFNCPGGGVMLLDGKAGEKDDLTPGATVHLDKGGSTNFTDEWDFVIDNYIVGANDPEVIDSVALIAFKEPVPQKERNRDMAPPIARKPPEKGMVSIPPMPSPEKPVPSKPLTIEEKFIVRTPKYVMDIPLKGDSIELRFYDNAEIDGDSISLFLNDRLVFQHIRLLAKPYVVKLAVADLKDSNELVMVAENLGKIPPNTSYMVAVVDSQRYEANLQSTEEISAMIKLVKPPPALIHNQPGKNREVIR